jgi:aspartate/methionine/tyrosine aminotransferase
MGERRVLARRMADIRPFHVMALLARARELESGGRRIVHMEIGEPDFDTPPAIVRAGHGALESGKTHYTPAAGLPALREAIARHYAERFDVDVSPSRIFVTPGASGALLLVLAALVDPGARVLMADPAYPCNRHFVRLLEGEPVLLPTGPETGYQLSAARVAPHCGTRTAALILASPSNPAGTTVPMEEIRALLEVVTAAGDARLIVDEIYHQLVYDEAPRTALSISDEVFIINSFSKYFGMTGWRLGWVVAPEAYCESLDTLAQNLFLAAPTPAQWAALAAFEPATLALLEERRRELAQRRDYLLPALRELGFRIPVRPQGAFYLYADCSAFTEDSFAFAGRALEEAGVAFTPGIDFGTHRAREHVRFSYTTSMQQLQEGVRRLGEWLGRA